MFASQKNSKNTHLPTNDQQAIGKQRAFSLDIWTVPTIGNGIG